MPRRVFPYQYGLPQVAPRQNGAFVPSGSVSETTGGQQQQTPPLGGLGLAKELFTSKPDILAGIIPTASESIDSYLASQYGAFSNPVEQYVESQLAGTPYYSNPIEAAMAEEFGGGLLGEGALGAESGLLGAEGVAPLAEVGLEAAPIGEAAAAEGLLGTGAAEGAGAAAAAEGGALAGLGAAAPWLALGGAGIYGLGSILDWW